MLCYSPYILKARIQALRCSSGQPITVSLTVCLSVTSPLLQTAAEQTEEEQGVITRLCLLFQSWKQSNLASWKQSGMEVSTPLLPLQEKLQMGFLYRDSSRGNNIAGDARLSTLPLVMKHEHTILVSCTFFSIFFPRRDVYANQTL
jgi:hypothetical protein